MRSKIILLFLLCTLSAFSQGLYLPGVDVSSDSEISADQRLLIAMSAIDYPVTPGDSYLLTFRYNGEIVQNIFQIGSDYTIDLNVFGFINTKNMTYIDLKQTIESTYAEAYSRSFPSLTIQSLGLCQVRIHGNIPRTKVISVYGNTRLSEVLSDNIGEYSSLRNIQITSSDGTVKQYDLYKGLFEGDNESDPMISPDDDIYIGKVEKSVNVHGAILRPGRYQLLPDENMNALLSWSGGYSENSDLSRIRIQRKKDSYFETLLLDSDHDQDILLINGDTLVVPEILSHQPVVYLQGGITNVNEDGSLIDNTDVETEVVHTFFPGDTLYDVMSFYRDRLSPYAELEDAYLIRSNEIIPVNLQEILFSTDNISVLELLPYDKIVIPEKHNFIFISGAVLNGGRLMFNSGANVDDYLARAGGIDRSRGNGQGIYLLDRDGKRVPGITPVLDTVPEPGMTIVVPENQFVFNFNQYFPIITSVLALITTIATLVVTLNQ